MKNIESPKNSPKSRGSKNRKQKREKPSPSRDLVMAEKPTISNSGRNDNISFQRPVLCKQPFYFLPEALIFAKIKFCRFVAMSTSHEVIA
jgi:hypothetical protein